MSYGRELLRRSVSGALWGLSVSVVLSMIATVVTIVSLGSVTARLGLSYWQVVSLYFIGGPLGGAIFGATWPLAKRYAVLAFIVGTVSVLPFTIGFAALELSPNEWPSGWIFVAGGSAVLLGGPLGLIISGRVK